MIGKKKCLLVSNSKDRLGGEEKQRVKSTIDFNKMKQLDNRVGGDSKAVGEGQARGGDPKPFEYARIHFHHSALPRILFRSGVAPYS